MDSLIENARRILDVAREGDEDNQDFALLIRPDGVLHFVMESPFSIEAAAIHAGAQSAFRITRSRDGVRVEGRSSGKSTMEQCLLQERSPRSQLLPDQALYRITSPLLTSCAGTS